MQNMTSWYSKIWSQYTVKSEVNLRYDKIWRHDKAKYDVMIQKKYDKRWRHEKNLTSWYSRMRRHVTEKKHDKRRRHDTAKYDVMSLEKNDKTWRHDS